jgi:hypothetical protein
MAAKGVLQAHRHFLLRVTDDAVLVVNCSYQLTVSGSRSNPHLGNWANVRIGPKPAVNGFVGTVCFQHGSSHRRISALLRVCASGILGTRADFAIHLVTLGEYACPYRESYSVGE